LSAAYTAMKARLTTMTAQLATVEKRVLALDREIAADDAERRRLADNPNKPDSFGGLLARLSQADCERSNLIHDRRALQRGIADLRAAIDAPSEVKRLVARLKELGAGLKDAQQRRASLSAAYEAIQAGVAAHEARAAATLRTTANARLQARLCGTEPGEVAVVDARPDALLAEAEAARAALADLDERIRSLRDEVADLRPALVTARMRVEETHWAETINGVREQAARLVALRARAGLGTEPLVVEVSDEQLDAALEAVDAELTR
jgi:chromosome segregation ATPase